MRTLKIFLFLLPTLVLAQKSQLSNAEMQSFKQEVAQHAEDLKTLSSEFTQTKYMQLMEGEAVSEGKLYYRNPDVLKWEYHDPYNYKILFMDGQLHLDDNGKKSHTSLRSNKLFGKLVSLISGSVNGKLLEDPENFEVTYSRNGNNIEAVIIPTDPSLKDMFSEIILLFNGEYLVDSVKLMEDSGDFTLINFRNISINKSIDEKIFQP
ncbi:MAG TPA: outer membrane lipoprotein carrier protein LolA [Gillisia sp.]|nr:outer membrane lipoprotein carrier protein LolA [Gillisia sp.]